jgi:hypothetical protein
LPRPRKALQREARSRVPARFALVARLKEREGAPALRLGRGSTSGDAAYHPHFVETPRLTRLNQRWPERLNQRSPGGPTESFLSDSQGPHRPGIRTARIVGAGRTTRPDNRLGRKPT